MANWPAMNLANDGNPLWNRNRRGLPDSIQEVSSRQADPAT